MPKQFVTAIGLVLSLGVIALGSFLVALPLFLQAASVDAETASVADTNAIYQSQVESLQAEEENIAEINATVDGLRAQLPATGQLDDVFEVVARAAEASGVLLTTVTAGEQVAFAARTGVTEGDAATPAPEATIAPDAEETDAEGADAAAGGTPAEAGASAATVAAGRQQVDFMIQATAADMGQVNAFLDALRAGPRLLSNITATSAQGGEGTIEVQVAALTYLDAEG